MCRFTEQIATIASFENVKNNIPVCEQVVFDCCEIYDILGIFECISRYITDRGTKEHNQVAVLSVSRSPTQNHVAQKFALGL